MSATRAIGSFIEKSWIPTLVLSAAVTAWIVFVGEGIDAYARSRLVDMVQGTAHRPYVYRVLVPGLARLGSSVFPASSYALVVLLMAVSLVGFAAGVRALSRAVFNASALTHSLTSLTAVAFLPLTFGPFSRQIYDFTTLCLFTWCLVFITERRWTGYAVTFALACLNKESSVLLTLVYAVCIMRTDTGLSKGKAIGLFVYQVAVFAAVRAAVVYAFRNNPGDTVEIHLFGHNQYVLLNPDEMSKRLLMLVGIVLVGVWSWSAQPAPLQRYFAVLAPTLVAMGLTVGVVDEIRAYYEIYSVVMLMAAFSVCRALGIPVAPAPRAAQVAARAGHLLRPIS